MDSTQRYIIRQSSAKTAFDFIGQAIKSSDAKWQGLGSADALKLAKRIESYVINGE